MTEQVAYTTVNITVQRNEFEPRFTSSEFRRDSLSEKSDVGTSIVTVRAEDRDGVRVLRKYFPYIFLGSSHYIREAGDNATIPYGHCSILYTD